MRDLVDAEVEEAIELADAAPSAAPETAFSGVYSRCGCVVC
jgi:TPP-dependent pyruvate/acetoin dehydrogenase alpha subunit